MSMRRLFAAALALICLLGALPARAEGAFTLMIYMCASDLESRDGAATSDLNEMVAAGLTPGAGVRVIVATGGASAWRTPGITPEQNQYFEVTDVGLSEIARPQSGSMCDPDTLTDFISFSTVYAPARRYALILWDHGSGPVAGFGYDERYGGAALSVPAMADAIHRAMGQNRLVFVGFDACFMASIECAWALRDAADYMVASQALEPGQGWDYKAVLTALARAPEASGTDLAARVVDGYARATLLSDPLGDATMSAVDLMAVDGVVAALNALADRLTPLVQSDFPALARARHGVLSFGALSGNAPSDLVDLVALSSALGDLAPAESAALRRATERAVHHARKSPLAPSANGLSVYFPYAAADMAGAYQALYGGGALAGYARFADAFAGEILSGDHRFADIVPEPASALDHLESAADAVAGWADALAGLVQNALGGDQPPAPAPDLWAGLEDVAPHTYRARMSPADAGKLSGARGVLMREIAGGAHALLGWPAEASIDRESGTVSCRIDPKVPTLLGEALCLIPIGEHAAAPVTLNGEDGYLCMDGDRILGATRGFDAASGMPVRTVRPLAPGDVVVPLYPRIARGALAGREAGAPITIGEDAPVIEYLPADPAVDRFSFELTSLYARVQFTGHVPIG